MILILENGLVCSNSIVCNQLNAIKASLMIDQKRTSKFMSPTTCSDFVENDDLDQLQYEKGTGSQFQDRKIYFPCFGDCGSKVMTFLVNETNLKTFKTENLPIPRLMNTVVGKGTKIFYQKFTFNSKRDQEQFCTIFENFIQNVTTNLDFSMGN